MHAYAFAANAFINAKGSNAADLAHGVKDVENVQRNKAGNLARIFMHEQHIVGVMIIADTLRNASYVEARVTQLAQKVLYCKRVRCLGFTNHSTLKVSKARGRVNKPK